MFDYRYADVCGNATMHGGMIHRVLYCYVISSTCNVLLVLIIIIYIYILIHICIFIIKNRRTLNIIIIIIIINLQHNCK